MEEQKIYEKPPLGLIPRYIWIKERKKTIFEAMERYSLKDYPIPIEWISELKELCMNDYWQERSKWKL